jgi:hypothetical protein
VRKLKFARQVYLAVSRTRRLFCIFATEAPISRPVSCDRGAATDGVEVVTNHRGSEKLRYKATNC